MLRPIFTLLLATASLSAQVSYDRLLHAADTPQNWLNYSGSFLSQRYSTLDQITPGNVKNLEQQVDFSGALAGEIRSYAAGGGWHPVYGTGSQRYRRDGRRDRTHFLDLLLQPGAASAPVLRAGESRTCDSGRHLVHGNHRRAHRRGRCKERASAVEHARSRIPRRATPSPSRRWW